jgi:hypothetical protein
VPVAFAEEVSFDITSIKYKRRTLKSTYPEPYFKIVDNKAIALQGYYVPQLFELQKRDVLTARGIFGKPDSTMIVQDVELEEVSEGLSEDLSCSFSKRDSMALIRNWKSFFKAIDEKDTQKIRAMSLDSVICSICEGLTEDYYESNMESIDDFITGCNRNFPDTALYVKMKSNAYKIGINKNRSKQQIIYEVSFSVTISLDYSRRKYRHTFQFVKIDDQFRFYGVDSY